MNEMIKRLKAAPKLDGRSWQSRGDGARVTRTATPSRAPMREVFGPDFQSSSRTILRQRLDGDRQAFDGAITYKENPHIDT